MDSKLEKQIRLLKTYAFLMTLVCGTFVVTGFVSQRVTGGLTFSGDSG
jgi:hypothetical protein